jgi:ABC-2 type transport system ATP-binding protein
MLRVDAVEKVFPRPAGMQRVLIRGASDEAVHALRGVDLQVAPGEVVGLVGPNGAGKTTLIKIIATLLEPTAGRVNVAGHDVRHDPLGVRRQLGLVLADDRSLYWRLTGRQNLEFFAAMHGLRRADARARVDELLERVGLADRDKLVFGYSSGMRSRLSIARALLARPRVLVLDEPTRALDPVACADVARLLREAAADGVAVLLSSHRVDEIETVCDRITVVLSGTVRFTGTAAELAGEERFATALHAMLAADELPVVAREPR